MHYAWHIAVFGIPGHTQKLLGTWQLGRGRLPSPPFISVRIMFVFSCSALSVYLWRRKASLRKMKMNREWPRDETVRWKISTDALGFWGGIFCSHLCKYLKWFSRRPCPSVKHGVIWFRSAFGKYVVLRRSAFPQTSLVTKKPRGIFAECKFPLFTEPKRLVLYKIPAHCARPDVKISLWPALWSEKHDDDLENSFCLSWEKRNALHSVYHERKKISQSA